MPPRGAPARAISGKERFDLGYWIISGPLSVGKSVFMASPRCAEITGLPPETPVVWASDESQLDALDSSDAYFHYNTLRNARIAHQDGENIGRNATRFDLDVPWTKL